MNLEIKHLWSHKCPKKWDQYTLIALVVTIVVLVILAAVSIKLISGSNGILGKASNSANKTQISSAKEQVELKDAELVANYYKNRYMNNNIGTMKAGDYVTNNIAGIIGEYIVKKLDDYEILVSGKGTTLIGTIDERSGKIIWSGEAAGGEKLDREVPIISSVVVTDTTATIVATDDVGITQYGYNTENTVPRSWQNTSTITGLTANTTYYFFAKDAEEKVSTGFEKKTEKTIKAVTASEILESKNLYYGKKVVNYKPTTDPNGVYRIFYVSEVAEFGDNANTIYLKRDHNTSLKRNLDSYSSNYNSESDTKIEEMNPDWAAPGHDGVINAVNEQRVAYLCDTTKWTNYLDITCVDENNNSYVNYVVGGPSLEMYVKSYNSVTHSRGRNGVQALKTKWISGGYTFSPGYGREWSSQYGAIGSIDWLGYNGMYSGIDNGAEDWYLASPLSYFGGGVCVVHSGGSDCWFRTHYFMSNGVCPLVSLKSTFQPIVEMD